MPARVFRKKGHTEYFFGVALSSDERRLASVGDDGRVLGSDFIGEGDESEPVKDIKLDNQCMLSPMHGVVFSAPGSSVITVSSNRIVAV